MKALKILAIFVSPFGLFLLATSSLLTPFIGSLTFNFVENSNIGFSIAVSLISTIITITLGSVISFTGIYYGNYKSNKIFEIVVLLPHIAFAYLVFLFFSDEGIVSRVFNTPMGLLNDRLGIGIILNYVLKEIPFIYLILLSTHSQKLKNALHTGKSLGGSKVELFTKIYLPMMKSPIVSGAIIIFAFALSNYEVPALLGNGFNKFTSVSIVENFQSINEEDNLVSGAQVLLIFITSIFFSSLLKKRYSK